jgi:transketolase
MKLNVKVFGVGGGLSDFNDGSSHQTLEDLAIVRAIPNICLLVPSDAVEAKWAVQAALNYNGTVYIRSSRNNIRIINDESNPYDLFRVNVRKQGDDAVIFSNGIMVSKALEAAEILEGRGISTSVVNIPCMKPIDEQGIIKEASGKRAICVAEEHSIIGGLGSCVAEILRKTCHAPIEFVGTHDSFGETAQDYQTLLDAYGLNVNSIVHAITNLI